MVMNFMRENKYMSYVYVLIRLALGWVFLHAGWGKITGPEPFNASGYLGNAVANPVLDKATGEPLYGWWVSFLENFALPNAELFNVIIPWGELFVGLGLILGCLTTYAVFFGMMMNFSFMFSGTVSSNPLDVLYGIFIIVGGFNAGKIGLDYWVMPWINNKCKQFKKEQPKVKPPVEEKV